MHLVFVSCGVSLLGGPQRYKQQMHSPSFGVLRCMGEEFHGQMDGTMDNPQMVRAEGPINIHTVGIKKKKNG